MSSRPTARPQPALHCESGPTEAQAPSLRPTASAACRPATTSVLLREHLGARRGSEQTVACTSLSLLSRPRLPSGSGRLEGQFTRCPTVLCCILRSKGARSDDHCTERRACSPFLGEHGRSGYLRRGSGLCGHSPSTSLPWSCETWCRSHA